MIDQPQGEKPALTVVIQSWWTPVLALIFLVVGLLAGYFGRPLVNKGLETTGDVAVVTTPAVTLPADQANVAATPADPTMAAISNQQQLMEYLVSHTTHFQGDPNAKVTIIEFSDYQ
jgi:protein-disulfide isomerase